MKRFFGFGGLNSTLFSGPATEVEFTTSATACGASLKVVRHFHQSALQLLIFFFQSLLLETVLLVADEMESL